uniref:GTD-binding domain-containing protein n=1 Tax=Davidia involucrata TaxID=16924 RepID=A0A5B7CC12_DAVIN
MAVRGTPSVRSQKVSWGFTSALVSAVLEWLLIFMLFVDAIFSYLVTKFARSCKLQIPCLLCSRLDHVLGNEKDEFYWDLICGNHKLEISSLVFCHVHNKLVDVHGMCENCLFSFATINKSNAETYRLLVGKLGSDPHLGLDQDPLLQDHNIGSSSTRNCSCCNEQWISGGFAQKLFQTKSISYEAAELDIPLSVAVGHNRDDPKNIRDEPSRSLRASPMGKDNSDPLSYVEYTKVKITSDTESEVPFSDDDNASPLIRETDEPREDFAVPYVHLEPRTFTLADDLTSEKLIHPDSVPKPALLESQVQLDIVNPHCCISVASAATIGQGLEELNWQQVENKADPSLPSELISFDEFPPSSNVMETPVEVSRETYAPAAGELGQKVVTESGGISKAGSGPINTSETGIEFNSVGSDTGLQMTNYLDLVDAYKLAVANKGRQSSGMLSEQRSMKDSTRISEDLKLLLSQLSATRGIEFSLNDMSPKVSVNSDELKASDASSSIGMQILQKRISLERNESGLSLDGSIVSEIEGESVVDRLKRQIEHDRKLMGALYKELEEERNASAVAANQTMAMITRLQEEKATLHMEALQCLRMMEEQAEYDVEALQKANDLIAEKEKMIQDLEAEDGLYRKKFGEVSMLENIVEPTCDLKAGDMRAEHLDASYVNNSAHSVTNKYEETAMLIGDKSAGTANNFLLEFENERLYIVQCLKNLEKKLHLFSDNGVYLDMTNGEYFGKEGDRLSDLRELNCKVGSQENSGTEEIDLSRQKDESVFKGSPRAPEGCVPSLENPQFFSKENSEFNCGGQGSSVVCRESELVDLGNEVSDLSGRLEALEADCNFLEHSINTVRNGDEGLKFIQEIACHLGELRRIGIRRRDLPFA